MKNIFFATKSLVAWGFLLSIVSVFLNSAIADTPKEISVVYCNDCVPFQFTNKAGKADGPIIDYWKIWSKKTGIKVNFVAASWSQTLESIRDGKVDAHAGLFFSEERKTYLDFGTPISDTDTHVFFHKGISFPKALSELKAYKIAVLKGDYVEGWLKERLGASSLVSYSNYPSIIAALNTGEIKLFAADTATGLFHLGRAGLLAKYKHQKLKPLYNNKFFTGVKKGNQELLDLINQGMSQISADEHLVISRTWATGQRADDADNIIIAIDEYYPPLSSIGIDGLPQGLMIDIWKEWGKAVGRKISFKASNWDESLNAIRTGEADIHFGLFKTQDRKQWMAFSQPLQAIKSGLFTKKDADKKYSLKTLKGQNIGAIKGSYQAEFVKEKHPETNLVEIDSRADYVMALIRGDITAIVEEVPTFNSILAKFGLNGIVNRQAVLFEKTVFAGVRKDNTALLELINFGLNKIPRSQLVEIEKRWISVPEDRFFVVKKGDVNLTKKEENWLLKHPVINMGVDTAYPPFEYVGNEGKYQGIIPDYFNLIGERLGIKIKPLVERTWAQAVVGVKNKNTDILSGLNDTQERRKFLNFTRPYLEYPYVFISRNSFPLINGHADLRGKTMAFAQGYSDIEEIKRDFPSIKILEVKNTLEALKAVATGKADATQGNLAVLSHLIKNNYFTNLKVAGEASPEGSSLAIGVRKDWPEFTSILDKALASITQEEHLVIRKNWISTSETKSKKTLLTGAEKKWIKQHPTISVAATPDWPPFEMKDEETGAHKGITADFLKLAAQKVGLKVKPEFGAWGPLVEKLKAKEIDVAPGLNKTPERENFLLFSEPFTEYFSVIFTRNSQKPIKEISELYGKVIAVEKGYPLAEVIKKDHPQIKLKLVDTSIEAIQLVSSGDVDAYIGNQLVGSYLIKKYLISNIKTAGFYNKIPGRLRFGVRNDWPLLKTILDKALATITEEESNRIIKTYTGIETSMEKSLSLTDKEREWINQHRTIRLGVDSSWPPFEFTDEDGLYSGLASSYMDALTNRLDITPEPQLNLTWTEAIKALENKEGIDVLPAVASTKERQKFMNFTKPYLSFPLVIATQRNAKYVGSLKDLYGERVGVVGGYYTEFVLNRDHPEINLVQTSTVGEGLEHLANGDVLAFIDNLGVITYEIDRLDIDGIKIAAPTDYKTELSIGVRKDWPELIPILNKALDKIGPKERSAIQNSWLAVKVNFGTDFKTILTWAIPIGGGAVFIIFVIILWNRKMGAEIQQRKRTEQKLQFTQYAVDHAVEAIFWVRTDTGGFVYVNETTCQGLGYSSEELMSMSIPQIDIDFSKEKLSGLVLMLNQQRFATFESRHRKKNGEIIDVEVRVYITSYEGGEIIVANANDITERKRSQEELNSAYQELGEAMGHIQASIDYASRIQRSILPDNDLFGSLFTDYFIQWEPRDVVGGDIYWASKWGEGTIVVLGDCTGHGVPGAFMSLLTTGAMSQALLKVTQGNCPDFLHYIHNNVQTTLGQNVKTGESDDGMELGVCYFEPNSEEMIFVGAKFDLYIVENGEIEIIKPTKSGIGYCGIAPDQQFNEHRVKLAKGRSFYMTSDGLVDQIGGKRRRMFGKKRFKELLLAIQDQPMNKQKEIIYDTLIEYQGDENRRDDVSLLGFKF